MKVYVGVRHAHDGTLTVYRLNAPGCFEFTGNWHALPELVEGQRRRRGAEAVPVVCQAGRAPHPVDVRTDLAESLAADFLGTGESEALGTTLRERVVDHLPDDRHWCVTARDLTLTLTGPPIATYTHQRLQ